LRPEEPEDRLAVRVLDSRDALSPVVVRQTMIEHLRIITAFKRHELEGAMAAIGEHMTALHAPGHGHLNDLGIIAFGRSLVPQLAGGIDEGPRSVRWEVRSSVW
jgi:hypothetical protein